MSLDIPYIPFATKGWDGQLGQRIVLKDTMGCPLMSHGVPWGLRDGMDWWTSIVNHKSMSQIPYRQSMGMYVEHLLMC